MMFKKIFYFLLICVYLCNAQDAYEVTIENNTFKKLFWNYAIEMKNQNDPGYITRHNFGKNIYSDTEAHEFSNKIKIEVNNELKGKILKNLNKPLKEIENIITVYIEIQGRFTGLYVPPILRIPLTFPVERISVLKDSNGKIIYTVIQDTGCVIL